MSYLARAVVQLPRISQLTEDTVANSFYFVGDSGDEIDAADATTLTTRLTSFYNDVNSPGTVALSGYLSECLSRVASAARIDFYSIPSTPFPAPPVAWGSPKQVRNWTLGAAQVGGPLPAEVTVALSYHADLTDVPETAPNPTPPPATIRPAARLRGRLFIGPLQQTTIAEDATTHEAHVATAFINALLGAGSALIAANTAGLVWDQFSSTEVNSDAVVGGFVDNAFDTQRRRGEAATVRSTFS